MIDSCCLCGNALEKKQYPTYLPDMMICQDCKKSCKGGLDELQFILFNILKRVSAIESKLSIKNHGNI